MGVASAQVSVSATCGSCRSEANPSRSLCCFPACQGPPLSPASPMMRSRLPLPSLFGLFGALLMLSPELLLGIRESFANLPLTDPGVRRVLAFAVEQYNQDRGDCTNYFKQLRVLKAQSQVDKRNEYQLKVELMKTKCKKKANKKKIYKKIQKCKPLRGNQEKPTCYFKVVPGYPANEMILAITTCT